MSQKKQHTKKIIQKHHIIYATPDHPEQEVTCLITKGEHNILSKMNWFTKNFISAGFIKSLKVFIALNEDRAVDLEILKKEEIDG